MDGLAEQAIRTFERIHKLRVTVHDIRGTLWASLAPERFQHSAPLCATVKMEGGQDRCFDFEVRRLRRELTECINGRVHVCHAGFVEWVLPVFHETELEWVLFAGPRLPTGGLTIQVRDKPSNWRKLLRNMDSMLPTPVEEAESADILEHLRQLAARLSASVREFESKKPHASLNGAIAQDLLAHRRLIVQRYIGMHHANPITLSDLAAHLSLSESRTSHLVTECCGSTFQSLLLRARLETAVLLLRFSALSVTEVALRSGFNDLAHFHRVFRRSYGATPARYRRSVGT
jgi:AraC-like DNA-binding protein